MTIAAAYRFARFHGRKLLPPRGRRSSTGVSLRGINLTLGEHTPPNIRTAIQRGRYERGEANAVEAILQAGDRVLEIGGGIGYISTLCARTAEVTVYEAAPYLISHIEKTLADNGASASVRNAVLVNAQGGGRVPFFLRDEYWESSLDGTADYASAVDVPTVSLAEVLAEVRPNVLVADIEGGEYELLKAPLPGVDRIIVEVHPNTALDDGSMMAHLSALGFRPHWASRGRVLCLTRQGG